MSQNAFFFKKDKIHITGLGEDQNIQSDVQKQRKDNLYPKKIAIKEEQTF